MSIKGAGGTNGGIGRFFIGFVMLIAGSYLFLNSITVSYAFNMGYRVFSYGGIHMTNGMILIPFLFGIGMIFYNSKNPIGWVLSGATVIMLVAGVIASINFRLKHMSAFELIMILTLMIGGLGLFLSSLKNMEQS